MPNYVVFLSDGSRHIVAADTGGAARRLVAKAIRMGAEGYNSPGVTIFRVRMVNRW